MRCENVTTLASGRLVDIHLLAIFIMFKPDSHKITNMRPIGLGKTLVSWTAVKTDSIQCPQFGKIGVHLLYLGDPVDFNLPQSGQAPESFSAWASPRAVSGPHKTSPANKPPSLG